MVLEVRRVQHGRTNVTEKFNRVDIFCATIHSPIFFSNIFSVAESRIKSKNGNVSQKWQLTLRQGSGVIEGSLPAARRLRIILLSTYAYNAHCSTIH